MENASKALLMAGGMLLAMLLVTVLIYAWKLFSEYQSSQDSLIEIEDTAKFNQQFTNYDRKDVQGYELLSLLNQIIDYNERKTTDSINGNKEQNNKISISINLVNEEKRKKFTYNNEILLFKQNAYSENELTAKDNATKTRVSFKTNIEDAIKCKIEEFGGTEDEVIKLAKNISSIYMTEQDIRNKATRDKVEESIVKNEILRKYNDIVANDIDDVDLLILKDGKSRNKLYESVCAYYEYMQFKRAIFECTELKYDDNTGRVSNIKFEFTGNIH